MFTSLSGHASAPDCSSSPAPHLRRVLAAQLGQRLLVLAPALAQLGRLRSALLLQRLRLQGGVREGGSQYCTSSGFPAVPLQPQVAADPLSLAAPGPAPPPSAAAAAPPPRARGTRAPPSAWRPRRHSPPAVGAGVRSRSQFRADPRSAWGACCSSPQSAWRPTACRCTAPSPTCSAATSSCFCSSAARSSAASPARRSARRLASSARPACPSASRWAPSHRLRSCSRAAQKQECACQVCCPCRGCLLHSPPSPPAPAPAVPRAAPLAPPLARGAGAPPAGCC